MKPEHLSKWDNRYLSIAQECSRWSKDPSTRVGAVAVNPYHGQILAQGYNGFPRGVRDDAERYKDREQKLKYTVHAELNCIFNASLSGASLYGATMYVYGLHVCHECAKAVIQSGIKCVVCRTNSQAASARWVESTELAKQMLVEAGVKLVHVQNTETESTEQQSLRLITG